MAKLKEILYEPYKRWIERGTIWLYSDPHFDDADCKIIDPDWISPEEQIVEINKCVGKYDTLIILGDIGNKEYIKKLKGYKVLIAGNHDKGLTYYQDVFNETYGGPIFIAEKILLSHEPINYPFALNIHGHDHMRYNDAPRHYNVCSNTVDYKPVRLTQLIDNGLLSNIETIHRATIDNATERKKRNGNN